jgi:hypothetical protein
MSKVGQKERETQNRLIRLFHEQLGYEYLGNWEERPENSNVEVERLRAWLKRRGHDERIIGKVLYELERAKALGGAKNLYDANREVYGLLRYSVMSSTRPLMTCSRIHLASQTMVRLLPLPWVCQMIPPSRRRTCSWAPRTPKY